MLVIQLVLQKRPALWRVDITGSTRSSWSGIDAASDYVRFRATLALASQFLFAAASGYAFRKLEMAGAVARSVVFLRTSPRTRGVFLIENSLAREQVRMRRS